MIIILIPALTFLQGCDLLFFPYNVTISEPAQAVQDARLLIKKFNEMPPDERKAKLTRYSCHLYEKDQLPPSLQLEIRYAFVCEDRVSLIFHRNPDNDLGLRIWRADIVDKGTDKPTKWSEIYTYNFNNDVEVSIENLP